MGDDLRHIDHMRKMASLLLSPIEVLSSPEPRCDDHDTYDDPDYDDQDICASERSTHASENSYGTSGNTQASEGKSFPAVLKEIDIEFADTQKIVDQQLDQGLQLDQADQKKLNQKADQQADQQ